MRILFGSWPGYGHLLPMAPLIRAAQQGGPDIVLSSGADMSTLIGRFGVAAHRSGVTLAESYARMPDHVTISELPAEEQPGFAARHLFGAGAVDRARDVRWAGCSTNPRSGRPRTGSAPRSAACRPRRPYSTSSWAAPTGDRRPAGRQGLPMRTTS